MLGLLAAGCSDGSDTTQSSAPTSDTAAEGICDESTYYVAQTAASGSVVTSGGEPRLVLEGASPTTWFSDRPERDAGVLDNPDLVAAWDEAFADTPVLAAVTSSSADGTVVVAADSPAWDPATGALSYHLDPDVLDGSLEALEALLADESELALFVDPAPLTPDCSDEDEVEWVFVQTARSGTVEAGDEDWTLALDAAGVTTAFSSGAFREAAMGTTDEFIATWADDPSVAEDPPNAVLVVASADAEQPVTLELSEPRVDGNRVIYRARPLDPQAEPPADFDQAVLFIDAYPTSFDESIPQVDTNVEGEAPAMPLGDFYLATASALSQAAENVANNTQSNATSRQSFNACVTDQVYCEGLLDTTDG